MSEAPGKGLLRFTGVLYIIFGVLSALFTILGLTGVSTFGKLMGLTNTNTNANTRTGIGSTIGGTLGGIMIAALVMMLILALFEIITGIVGISNSDKPYNANACITLAIIMIILQIASGLVGTFNWISIIGLLLPILYLIGAIQNRGAAIHHYSGAH